MLLVAIISLFSLLALGLLALLDRYDTAMIKSQADRQSQTGRKLNYYDAFADRRQQPRGTPGEADRRQSVR